jgi:hypothetical protein
MRKKRKKKKNQLQIEKKITDLKKYKKGEKRKTIPKEKEIFDKEGNRLLDLDKHQNKNQDLDIDLFDKNGKKIKKFKKIFNKRRRNNYSFI